MKIVLLYLAFLAGSLSAQVTISGSTTCQQGTTCTYTASGGTGPYVYSLASGSVGSINSSSGVYTAPSSVTPSQVLGGCQVHPNNHVFNTAIDSLPVNTLNRLYSTNLNGTLAAASISFQAAFWKNVGAVSSDQTQTMQFLNTPSITGQAFHIDALGNNFRQSIEGGAFTSTSAADRHMHNSFKDSCNAEEIYKAYPNGFYIPNNSPTPGAGNAQGGSSYSQASLAIATTGVDAAGMEMMPLLLRTEELKAGEVKHALRIDFTSADINNAAHVWPASSDQTVSAGCQGGYVVNTSSVGNTVTFISNQNGFTSFFPILAGDQIIVNTVTYTIATVPDTTHFTLTTNPGIQLSVTMSQPKTSCQPYGTRWRLKAAFNPSNGGLSGNQLVYFNRLVTQGKTYGYLTADNGTEGAVGTFLGPYDADVIAAFNQFNAVVPATGTALESIDESSLQTTQLQIGTSASWGEAKWDNSGGQTISGFAVVHAVDSMSVAGNFSVSLQAVAVGAPRVTEPIQAGTGTVQLTGWATGASNTAVAWSLGACTGASITSGGLVTVPATVSGRRECVATATSVADGTKSTDVNLVFLPAGSPLRIDVGNTAGDYTDGASAVWTADLWTGHVPLWDTMSPDSHNGAQSWTGGISGTSPTIFNTVATNRLDDSRFHLNVLNGTYLVTLYYANLWTSANFALWETDAQGATVIASTDPYVSSGNTQFGTFSESFSATVSNHSLDFNLRMLNVSCASDPDYNAPLCHTPSYGPTLAAFTVALTSCVITPAVLPAGTFGVAYSQALTNTNCSASTYTISAGSLCTGLSLNPSTGVISGLPTVPQACTFTVAYDTATVPLSILINPPALNPGSVSAPGVGVGTTVVH